MLPFVNHVKCPVRACCYIFIYFSIFNLTFIYETFLHAIYFAGKTTLTQTKSNEVIWQNLYEKGDREKGVKNFVDWRAEAFVASLFVIILNKIHIYSQL